MRLNRFLSSCGLGSRRGSEQIILDGRVRINGEVCTNLGTRVAESDAVTVDGKSVRTQKGVVIALHKPKGFVCTREDERQRRTIYDLLSAGWTWTVPA
jgi:23S rRNA pseudouridine2605 synthase